MIPLRDLTSGGRDCLWLVADLQPTNGARVIDAINDIGESRVYRILDELVELGLVEKEPVDGRENQYQLTDAGESALHDRLEWELACFGDC